MAPPRRINIISHNLWLIPFAGPCFLGRHEKCAINLANTTFSRKKSEGQPEEEDDEEPPLVIFAVQEAWAFRCGLLKPVLNVVSFSQSYYLKRRTSPTVDVVYDHHCGLRIKSCDPLWLKIFSLLVQTFMLFTHVFLLLFSNELLDAISGIYCPKRNISKVIKQSFYDMGCFDCTKVWDSEMGKLAGHNLFRNDGNKDSSSAFTSSSASAILSSAPNSMSYWPFQPVMDSGLLVVASQTPDEHGFEPYDPHGTESFVNKGMLWMRFGDLVVINTHMTAEKSEFSKNLQNDQMQLFCQKLFREKADGNENENKCKQILLVGDFNHFEPSLGSTILPKHANTKVLLNALQRSCPGRLPKLLSKTKLTNEDGCIDHVIGLVNPRKQPLSLSSLNAEIIVIPPQIMSKVEICPENGKYIYLGDDAHDHIQSHKQQSTGAQQSSAITQKDKKEAAANDDDDDDDSRGEEQVERYHTTFCEVYSDPDWHISDHYKIVTELELRCGKDN
jgi:hypothetical protein